MKKNLAPRSFSEVGFTLIEILVVVTIMVMLTAGAVVSYSTFLRQSRDARRKADLEQIKAALELYRSNNDTYPVGTCTDIAAGGCVASILTSPTIYIQKLPSDPKNPTYTYYYTATSSDYTIGTYAENDVTTCIAAKCGLNCTYCLGPYGEK